MAAGRNGPRKRLFRATGGTVFQGNPRSGQRRRGAGGRASEHSPGAAGSAFRVPQELVEATLPTPRHLPPALSRGGRSGRPGAPPGGRCGRREEAGSRPAGSPGTRRLEVTPGSEWRGTRRPTPRGRDTVAVNGRHPRGRGHANERSTSD